MQYCYNLVSTTDPTKNIFGICMEQDVLYEDGEIITFNSHVYEVYKCVQNFFKQPDSSRYLGNPSLGMVGTPDELKWTFNSMIYNGVEQITIPIEVVVDASDYQNFKADTEGFNFYQAPWNNTELINTTMFVSKLNGIMNSFGIPINAVMYTQANQMERFCLLMRESDSFSFIMEKDWRGAVWEYEIGVDYTAGELQWRVDAVNSVQTFEEATDSSYAFRTEDRCPCSRGAHSYSFISCEPDIYPSFNVCSLTQLFFLNSIVYLITEPTKYYTAIYLGQNAELCDEYITQDDIGQTNYKNCEEATAIRYYEVLNCSTGKRTVFGISPSDMTAINEPCGECAEGATYNPDTGYCETILHINAVFNGKQKEAVKGDISPAYGWGGAKFYEEITSRPKPISETNTPYRFTDSSSAEVVVLNTVQGVWDNTTGSNGRLNIVGIKSTGDSGQWFGFSKCLTMNEKKVVFIGIGADDYCRVKVNGDLIIQMNLVGDQGSHTHWHVFPLELNTGDNIVEVDYYNGSGAQSFGAEIYDATQAEIYSWTTVQEIEDSLLFSTKDMIGLAMTGQMNGWSCPEGYALDYCDNPDVPVCTRITREEQTICDYPVIKVNQYPCDCFDVVREVESKGETVTVIGKYKDCDECREQVGTCGHSERTIAYSVMVRLPEPPEPDRGFKECCYDNIVLASLTDDKYSKNDFNSFYFKRQLPSDECEFTLIDVETGSEYALNNGTYGIFWDFGDFTAQPDLTVYKVEWRKVLQVLGSGKYQIRKDMIIAGIPFPEYSNTYNLEQYTTEKADKTVRIDCVMDGKLVHIDTDFKGTGFTTSLRTKGYFGNRNPDYKQDNLVKRNYDTIQISMSQENEYQYQTGLLPICITEQLFDFILFGNKLYMNDYNASNHSYQYSKFPVELAGNKGTKYYVNKRDSRINLTFTDREKDKRKLNC